ncbi:MAG TPA: hypothetical protein VF450_02905 [Noviherbaspirillum sp.]
MTTQHEHYENFVDFLEIGQRPKSERKLAANRPYDGSTDHDWLGIPRSWPTDPAGIAKRLMLGYQEGAERVRAMRETISLPSMVNVRRRPVWGEQGDFVDMDRVRAGQLDTAWRGVRKVTCQPPRVLILADTGANFLVEAEAMAWRGVAALALADALNAAGYQVGIVQGHKLKIYADGNYRLLITTVVKPFRAPLSVLDLASAIVLPATFRSIGLGASWYLADKDLSGGCGCHVDMGTVDAPDMGQNLTVVLDSNICDAATARTWVEQQIQTIEGAHRQAA